MEIIKKTKSAIFWNAGANYCAQIINYILIFYLARLLSPEEFGIIAIITLLIGFATILQDFGISSAIIQKEFLSKEYLDTAFSINLIIGICLTIIFYTFSNLIAEFFNVIELKTICKVISFVFLVNSFSIPHLSLLKKEFRFKDIFWIEIISTLFSVILVIILSFFFVNVMLYVTLMISYPLIKSIIIKFKNIHKFQFIVRKKIIKEIYSFSAPLFGSKTIFYWTQNIDNLIVAKFFTKMETGIYNQALNLANFSSQSISSVVNQVLLSTFSALNGQTERLKDVYLTSLSIVSFLSLPVTLGVILVSDIIVLNIFGEKWYKMIELLNLLSIFGAIKSIGSSTGPIFISKAETGLQFRINLFLRPITITCIIIGSFFGLVGIALGRIIGVLMFNIVNFVFVNRILKTSYRELFLSIGPNLLNVSIMLVVIGLFKKYQILFEQNSLFLGLIIIVLSIIVYLLATILFNRKLIKQLIKVR